jgi:hypothetical protein
MKRSAFDPNSEVSATPIKLEQRKACMVCGTSTLKTMLSQYGARCLKCFEFYQTTKVDYPPLGDRTKSGTSWAVVLRGREQRGERLSPMQKEMWRAALKVGKKEAA